MRSITPPGGSKRAHAVHILYTYIQGWDRDLDVLEYPSQNIKILPIPD